MGHDGGLGADRGGVGGFEQHAHFADDGAGFGDGGDDDVVAEHLDLAGLEDEERAGRAAFGDQQLAGGENPAGFFSNDFSTDMQRPNSSADYATSLTEWAGAVEPAAEGTHLSVSRRARPRCSSGTRQGRARTLRSAALLFLSLVSFFSFRQVIRPLVARIRTHLIDTDMCPAASRSSKAELAEPLPSTASTPIGARRSASASAKSRPSMR